MTDEKKEPSKTDPIAEKKQPAGEEPKVEPRPTEPKPADTANPEGKPKKSKKGCCIVAFAVFVVLILSSLRGFAFLAFLPWSESSDYDIPFIPESESTTTVATNTTPAETEKKKTASTGTTKSKTAEVTPPANTNTVKPPPDPVVTPQPPQATGPQTTFTKQEEIDYFIKEAITDEKYNFQAFPLHKWTKRDLKVIYADHTPIAENEACADQTISIINSLTNNIHLTKTTDVNNFDIAINFMPLSEINQRGYPLGYMYYDLNADNSFKRAYAIVPSDNMNQVACHTIRHEMTHTIGLLHNLNVSQGGYHYSIFNVPIVNWSDYINIDKDLIKIMYNTSVQPGWFEAQTRAYLATATW